MKSHYNWFCSWQELIANDIVPAYLKTFPADVLYITNLTRATTLVCDPGLQMITTVASAIGGSIQLESTNSTAIGNIAREYATYQVFNFATQQALSTLGIFRNYLLFGLATGNAIFDADPANPANGTVPKPLLQISANLVS